MSVLIVIPVRGGSLGVPGKAIRPLADGPSCVQRIVDTAQAVSPHVVCVVDDLVRGYLAAVSGVGVVADPPGAPGSRPLDVVVHHGVVGWEALNAPPDIVVTLQATSPFTSVALIERAIAIARKGKTALTVREDRALRWQGPLTNRHPRSAPERLTRQQMQPVWRETGAVWATPRCWVTPTSRLAPVVDLLEVTGAEAVDIDTVEDWAVAEWYAQGVTV